MTEAAARRGELALTLAGEADLPALACVRRSAAAELAPISRAFAWRPGEPGVDIYCAVEAGACVGYLVIEHAGDQAHVHELAVAGGARRRGIATALLAHAIRAVRSAGASGAWLELREGNAAARALYERAGFRATGRRPHYYRESDGSSEDAIVMRLDFAGDAPARKLGS